MDVHTNATQLFNVLDGELIVIIQLDVILFVRANFHVDIQQLLRT